MVIIQNSWLECSAVQIANGLRLVLKIINAWPQDDRLMNKLTK